MSKVRNLLTRRVPRMPEIHMQDVHMQEPIVEVTQSTVVVPLVPQVRNLLVAKVGQTRPDDPGQHSTSWTEDAFRGCTHVARAEVPHGLPQTTARLPIGRGFEGLSALMGTRKRRRMVLFFTLWRVSKWLR